MTWRPTPEDRKLIDELKAKTGVTTGAQIMRMALRVMATKEGISSRSEQRA